ncbi:MAG: PilT domain-containing protein [Xanthobacteraceae bacterium]|nr:MAG: PilT domain-containing protein [Xanthobacteraceae bacterium]
MIVVDTSALMAIVLGEPGADACAAVLEVEQHCLISAATLAETMIVAERRNVAVEIADLVEGLAIEVVPVTTASARHVAAAYGRLGKGVHPAGLNFGDCFAYALARERGCPLLFVGEDFSRTDIAAAIPP